MLPPTRDSGVPTCVPIPTWQVASRGSMITFIGSQEDLSAHLLDAVLGMLVFSLEEDETPNGTDGADAGAGATSGRRERGDTEGSINGNGDGAGEQGSRVEARFSRAVKLAVQWGEQEKALSLLDQVWGLLGPTRGAKVMDYAVQVALEGQNLSFLLHIFRKAGSAVGATVGNVDLCRLYRDRGGVDRIGCLNDPLRRNSKSAAAHMLQVRETSDQSEVLCEKYRRTCRHECERVADTCSPCCCSASCRSSRAAAQNMSCASGIPSSRSRGGLMRSFATRRATFCWGCASRW